ncbi:hypothetical protein ACJJTC_004301 [Scirpophaga incertulas]
MNFFLLFFVLFVWKCAAAEESNYVYTYQMATQCKEHVCQNGYSYDTFYSIYAEDTENMKFSGPVHLEMHIAIQGINNGHILLSPIPFPNHTDPVYEIVVGGGSNKFTELRRNLKRNAKTSQVTVGILSSIELRGFYVKIYTSGLIEFGKEGATLPILSYFDTSPLDIGYFSFATWTGVEAKFLYDCPAPGDIKNLTLPNSKTIKRKMSYSERLKKELLQDRPPHLAPGPIVDLSLGVLISGVSFNAYESKLTTRMVVLCVWRDLSLSWNPEKFNNLTSVTYRQSQVWRPMLHIFNSDSITAMRTSGYELIRLISTGNATFHFKAIVDTWCFWESPNMNKWPHDSYSCTIVLEPWEAHEKIIMTTIDHSSEIIQKFIDTDALPVNGWQILNYNQTIIPFAMWNDMYPAQDNITHQSDRLVIQIDIQREASIYNIVFYTPLVVLMLFVLLSFWSEPLQMRRVWYYASATTVVCMGLFNIDSLIPCHTIPSVLILYLTVLGGILLALLIQVTLMTSVAENLCKTMPVEIVLSSKYVRALCCLPFFKIYRNYNTTNEGYSPQEDDDFDVTSRNGNIEEMQEDSVTRCQVKEVAEIIDKLLFVIYSLVFAILWSLHF